MSIYGICLNFRQAPPVPSMPPVGPASGVPTVGFNIPPDNMAGAAGPPSNQVRKLVPTCFCWCLYISVILLTITD